MALLQHQNSMAAFEKHNGRCTWSWLQIFDSRQHQSSRRLLEHASQGSGTKVPKFYVPLPAKEHENWASEPNLLIGNKGTLKKSLSNAILKGLSKMLFKKQFQKQKALPAKQRLQRTTSIHHWECNDYVLPEKTVNCADIAESEENIPLVQRGKRCEICRAFDVISYIENTQIGELKTNSTDKEAKRIQKLLKTWESVLKRKGTAAKDFEGDVALQSKDFVTILELFDVHKDLFLKILKDPRFSLEKILKDIHSPSSEKSFVKPGSFPHGISAKRNAQSSMRNHGWVANFDSVNKEVKHNAEKAPMISQVINKDLQTLPSKTGIPVDTQKSERATVGTSVSGSTSETLYDDAYKQRNQEEDERALHHVRDFFEHIINETKKEHPRISKDAVMHKIPYGQKITEDVGTSKLFRSNSDRSYNDGLRFKSGAPSIKYQVRSARRTRSLSDSLDRYSNLLASVTTKESKTLPHTLSSIKEYNTSQNAVSLEPLESSVSNLDIIPRHFNKEIQRELFDGSVSSVVDTLDDVDNGVPSITATDRCIPAKHKEQSFLSNRPELNEQRHTVASAEEYVGSFNLRQQMVSETFLSDDELKITDTSEVPDSKVVGNNQTAFDEQKDEFIVHTGYEAIKPSPISTFDLYLEGDFDSSANYAVSEEELSLQSSLFNESISQDHKLDFDVSARLEATESTTIRQEAVSLNHTDAIQEEYENEFNYVKNVLKQFSFSDMEIFLAGPSLYQLGHFQNGESIGQFDQSSVSSSDYDDTYVYQKLLEDLINEVLSEIYEKSFGSMWFSRYSSQLRGLPVGDRLVTEVWAKISCHLISQEQTIHSISARDLAKNDKWLNLPLSAESLGNELTDLMLDHMLEELILEFDDV